MRELEAASTEFRIGIRLGFLRSPAMRQVRRKPDRFDEHINTEFREFLANCNCTQATVNGVWY